MALQALRQRIKHHFQEVIKEHHTPHSIALGFALGAFISIIPTFGFAIVIGLLLMTVLERINKFSFFLALAIINPFTQPFIYWASYQIGSLLLGSLPVVTYELTVLEQIYRLSRRIIIGNLVLAISISVTSYFLIKTGLNIRRKRKNAQ